MRWSRRRAATGPFGNVDARAESGRVRTDLELFLASRRGVEAFVEPATTLNPATVVLVAADGEWTRRPLLDGAVLRQLARDRGLPVYDVQLVGYPQRMREWNARRADRRPGSAG